MTIDELNALAESGGISEFIRVCEARQCKALSKIADDITERPGVRLILLAGASSAGKTTTKKLAVGSKVKIKSGAHIYGTTRTFASYVYGKTYKVIEISGNRVVLATTDGKTVIGAVAKSDCIIQ